ncbi:MAG: hypothetical protein WCC12_06160, partial [Anaerolineales bacterium]
VKGGVGKSNGGVSEVWGEEKYLEPGSKIHFCHYEEGVLPDEAMTESVRIRGDSRHPILFTHTPALP